MYCITDCVFGKFYEFFREFISLARDFKVGILKQLGDSSGELLKLATALELKIEITLDKFIITIGSIQFMCAALSVSAFLASGYYCLDVLVKMRESVDGDATTGGGGSSPKGAAAGPEPDPERAKMVRHKMNRPIGTSTLIVLGSFGVVLGSVLIFTHRYTNNYLLQMILYGWSRMQLTIW